MKISEDVSDKDTNVPPTENIPQVDDPTPLYDPPEVEPLVSLNALTSFSNPQNLKLIGYIKNSKVVIQVITAFLKRPCATSMQSIILKS